jgi:HAD superfamily hydrolase (TIGR01490 family)
MAGMDFFDVDHTLTRHSSGARYITLAIRKGILPLRLLFIVPYYTLTYRLGVFRLKKYADGFPYLRGLSKASLETLAKESFEAELRGDVFPEAASLVREKRKAGRRVVLATSSLDIIVRPLADHLGVTDVIATTLEFKEGVCTGMVSGSPMFRGEKQKRVLQFIAEAGERREDCSFYSDSIYDLPLLDEVGEPVAVNPDFRLRRIARARGWRIMDFR